LNGLTAKLFFEFALTLSCSVLLSVFISLTLSPVMSMYLLSGNMHSSGRSLKKVIDYCFMKLTNYYVMLLKKSWLLRKWVWLILIIFIVSSIVMLSRLPVELAPREDQGFLQVIGQVSGFTTSSYLELYGKRLNNMYQKAGFINHFIHINNIPSLHQFISFVDVGPENKRGSSISFLHDSLQKNLNKLPGAQAIVIEPSSLPTDGGAPIEYVLKTTLDEKTLMDFAKHLQNDALKSQIFRFVDIDTKFDHSVLAMKINRPLADWLNVDLQKMTRNLTWLLGEEKLGWFALRGESYPIILHTEIEPINFSEVLVRNKNGNLLPLDKFVHLDYLNAPNSLNQFQKMRSVTLSAAMRPKHYLSEGLEWFEHAREKYQQKNIFSDYAGEARTFLLEKNNNYMLFIVALIIIWLVLAVHFNSFKTPLVVLLGSLPPTIFSTLLVLFSINESLNIYSEIGLLTLVGLISKHGILIVEFALKLQRQQKISVVSAIQRAAILRLRPILMTTLAMLFSALPLVFASGAGAHSRFSLGIVISSGIFFGTFFTLLLVPAFYYLIENEER